MVNVKLSQIASAPANADANTKLVGVESGATDQQWTLSQVAAGVLSESSVDVVRDFGADPTGATDTVIQLQAAIDFAYNNGIAIVTAPQGTYKTSKTLFLDPPGNLRTNFSNPTIFGWTLCLVGVSGTESVPRTRILGLFDNAPTLVVGPGVQNRVIDIAIDCNVSVAHPKVHGTGHVALYISGGNAGALRTTVTRVAGINHYLGCGLGLNNSSQAERNFFEQFITVSTYIGFYAKGNNDCIHNLLNCSITGTIAIISNGAEVNIEGGENGVPSSPMPSEFTAVSAVSALTRNGIAPFFFTFTATITTPNSFWTNGVYNRFVIALPHFGLVPLVLSSYSAGTATFIVDQDWQSQYYYRTGDTFLDTATDFSTELQAVTNIYSLEWVWVYVGPVRVHNWRHEWATGHTMALTAQDKRAFTLLTDGKFNGDITAGNFAVPAPPTGTAQYAHWAAQQVCPILNNSGDSGFPSTANYTLAVNGNGILVVKNNAFFNDQSNSQDSVCFELEENNGAFYFENSDIFSPNIRIPGGAQYYPGAQSEVSEFSNPYGGSRGIGLFDSGYHGPRGLSNTTPLWGNVGSRRTPRHGYYQDRGSIGKLTPADVTAHIGATGLGSTYNNQSGAIQPLIDHDPKLIAQAGAQQYCLAKHVGGEGFTYGFTLSVNWNCKGQTPFFNITGGTHQSWLFAGLNIIIDLGDGSGPITYTIIGVYASAGYIAVSVNNFNASANPGVKTTVYSGTTIGQIPFKIKKYARQCEFVVSALSELPTGQPFDQGDHVWRTGAITGTSPGWACTTAGKVGSGVGFSPLSNLGAEVFP